jgi:hypothetical protein
MNRQYIGDSVYVERDDSWHSTLILILTTENGLPRDPRSNRIVLEPEVWLALMEYVKRTCPHNE